MIRPLIVLHAEIRVPFLLEWKDCQRILHYWTLWTTRSKNVLGVQGCLIVKLVTRSTLQISAAYTAKKRCARLQLSFILATKQVVTIALFPSRR